MTNETLTKISTSHEAVINSKTGRPAGPLQGILLLIGSCLPVLGAVLLSPILPTLSSIFKSTPGSQALVPLILTIPALFIAILSPFVGAVADKVGRKRILIIALVVYAIVGTAPLYLASLAAIVISRAAVGVTEAVILTCCTTLIADYFTGNRRNKYLGLQALVTSLSATVFFVVGGAVGAFGWRTPFWIYVISIIVAVAMIGAIWPTQTDEKGTEKRLEKLPPVPWRKLALPTIVALFGGVTFYTLIVELSYVLAGHGVTQVAIIGLGTAIASLATAIGAFLFRSVAKRGVQQLLPFAFGVAGIGMLIVWLAPSVPLVIVGAVVAGFGNGILLPTMITWSISRLEYAQRGRGTGLFTGAIFLGEFVSPLVVLALTGIVGTLVFAIGIIGFASIAVAIILAIVTSRYPQPALDSSATAA